MAGLKRDANIFKVLAQMKKAWEAIQTKNTSDFSEEELEAWRASQRRFQLDGSDVRQSFLSEFEDFLFSCVWTNSEVVKEIVGYIKRGVPLNQICDLVGLKNSAFRMRIARMTEAVNDLLFDGQSCPRGIYFLTDLAALKKCLVKIRLVRERFDINKEFTLRQLGWIQAHVDGIDNPKVGPENLDNYIKSVLFFALTSRSFTLALLDKVDPTSLACAYNDMQSDGVNSAKLLFSLLLRRLTFDSVACKEELSIVKREYYDYLQG